ncbi:MAG: amino acid adenylation domain-containing protein [Cyanobacteria bacterium J06554_6]
MSVHHLVESQASKTPDAVAVSYGEATLSYQELDGEASKLSAFLKSLGVKTGDIVGLCVDRSFDLIIGVLGIIKTGAAYLPLDSTYPQDRLRFMVEDAQSQIVLTQSHLVSKLPETDCQYVCLDQAQTEVPVESTSSIAVDDSNVAYVIYTSGSTGQPKGVAMPHRPLLNLLKWQTAQLKQTAANTLQFTPISFDVSFQEIFLTLTTGGTLFLIDDDSRRDSEQLFSYLSTHKIERLFLPFVALQNLAEVAVQSSDLPIYLTEVITAGEQLKITRSIAKWFATLDCTLCNQYGPSESHVVSAYTLTGQPKDWPHLPPIGKPITNAKFYLLDQSRRRREDEIRLVNGNEPGELAIGGDVLAQGYLNRPELNQTRFIPDPFSQDPNARLYRTGDLVQQLPDGNYKFIERIDHQVKIRGMRVELGEIEAQLGQHADVKDVAVTAREDEDGRKCLVAYVVPSKAEALFEDDGLEIRLRDQLKQQLPSHMLPSFFVFVAKLPLTPSGKVDRRALPAPNYERPALGTVFVAPRNAMEERLAEIWSRTLTISPIGIEDNFFDIGGDSLRAIQLVHQIRDDFNVDLPMVSLFDAPTISQFVQTLTTAIKSGQTATSDDISIAALESEASLAPDVDPSGLNTPFPVDPQNLLITGITGFLGVFLLQELLEQTPAQVHCLTRAQDELAGLQKIEANLQRYGLWKERYRQRITPVIGDLAKPRLGLSQAVWSNLAQKVEAIFHSGASISLINPYATMRAANVLGTQELLRLATQVRLKPFHFISTLDVFQTGQAFSSDPIAEQDCLDPAAAVHFDGYTKSKWVSEQMVWAAKERGLPVAVYRPAMISGHSQTGIANTGDLMNRLIKGFIQLGCAPQSDMVINIAPADFFSKGVVYLSQQPESMGKAFNFINPNPVNIGQFVSAISDCGYPVQLVDHATWEKTLSDNIDWVDGIVSVLTSKMSAEQSSYIERSSVNAGQVSCQNVLNGLAGTSIQCPNIDVDFLAPYLAYFAEVGFIQPKMDPQQAQPVTLV